MEQFKKIESLAEHVKEYVNTRISLIKLQIAEKVSKIIATIFVAIFGLLVLFFFFVFLALSAAHGIGDALGRPWLGFLIVGVFFLLVGLIILKSREKLFRVPVMNAIIRQLFEEKEEQNEKHQKP